MRGCLSGIAKKIRSELIKISDKKTKDSSLRFFKEPVKCFGVKSPSALIIAKKYWNEIKDFEKQDIYSVCEKLLSSDYMEEAFVVCIWGMQFNAFTTLSDLKLFTRWINKYINNWAKCDAFCSRTIGDFMQKYPHKIPELEKWAKSKNRWMRRASAVSLIVPAKKGLYLKESFRICSILLKDNDDMAQKGYGWLLKEESRKHQKEVFDFVMKNKKEMPRTALRYAIELMPAGLRAKAMEK